MTKTKKPRTDWYRFACSTLLKLGDARRERDEWKALYNKTAAECNRVKAALSRVKKAVDDSQGDAHDAKK